MKKINKCLSVKHISNAFLINRKGKIKKMANGNPIYFFRSGQFYTTCLFFPSSVICLWGIGVCVCACVVLDILFCRYYYSNDNSFIYVILNQNRTFFVCVLINSLIDLSNFMVANGRSRSNSSSSSGFSLVFYSILLE